jgi:hypothetical protein
MKKKLFVLIAAIAALSSCSDIISNAKKVKVKRYFYSEYKHSWTTSISVKEIIVDTIFNVGDTVEHNREMYIIVK